MRAQDFLKMAQLQTVLDCVKLLEALRKSEDPAGNARIDEMILRLTNMAPTL